MGIPNLKYFKKSYMLEFRENQETVNMFTFSIPPEGEDFDFGQRVTETKTFGGSVFDRYGNDTVKINLSGCTGNEDKKIIYRGIVKPPLYLNGEREVWELQKVLEEWHNLTNDSGGSKEIYLYDLSKLNLAQFVSVSAGQAAVARNYWKVFVKNLKIKRNASKPNQFNYTLEMLGLVNEPSKQNKWLSSIADAASGFDKALNAVQQVMDYTEGAVAAVESATSAIAKCRTEYEKFRNMSTSGQVLSVFKMTDSAFSRILTGNTNNTFYNIAKDCLAIADQCAGIFREDYRDTSKSSKTLDTSTFYVNFNSNGGSEVARQKVEYAKTAAKPTDPALDKFTFAGWYSDSALTAEYDFNTEVTANITLYAKWTLAVAVITFNSRNGSAVPSQNVAVGQKGTCPENPARNGYAFNRWNTDYSGNIPYDWERPVTENIMLYASWTDVSTVTFNSNGGSAVASQIVVSGGKAVYPLTPAKANYTFSCWCSDAELTTAFDFSTVIDGDITLYAKFVQISNVVQFRSNGGSAVENQTVLIGAYAAEPVVPTREGHDFLYWCSDIDLTNEFHFDTTPINGAVTLYAKWAAKVLTVAFDSNGGSDVDSQSVNYKELVVFPEIPVKENAVFNMWQTKARVNTGTESGPVYEDVYSEYDFSTPVTSDITLYAKWFGGQ